MQARTTQKFASRRPTLFYTLKKKGKWKGKKENPVIPYDQCAME